MTSILSAVVDAVSDVLSEFGSLACCAVLCCAVLSTNSPAQLSVSPSTSSGTAASTSAGN